MVYVDFVLNFISMQVVLHLLTLDLDVEVIGEVIPGLIAGFVSMLEVFNIDGAHDHNHIISLYDGGDQLEIYEKRFMI